MVAVLMLLNLNKNLLDHTAIELSGLSLVSMDAIASGITSSHKTIDNIWW